MLKGLLEKLRWLDPFTYVDRFLMPRINPSNNQAVSWAVYIVSAFVFAWVLYSALGVLFGTSAPIVVVVSPSMEPVYFRGDAIVLGKANAENVSAEEVFLQGTSLKNTAFAEIGNINFSESGGNRPRAESISFSSGKTIPITTGGSIVVYFSSWRQQPIIHRAVAKIHAADGIFVLTKGDSVNNFTIDEDCGRVINGLPERECISLYPVPVSGLQGRALLRIPVVGCVKLWALDNLISIIQTGRLPRYFSGVC